jgi:hypothetical protein
MYMPVGVQVNIIGVNIANAGDAGDLTAFDAILQFDDGGTGRHNTYFLAGYCFACRAVEVSAIFS